MAGLSLIVALCLTSGLWLGAESCSVRASCSRCKQGWSRFGCYCYKYYADAKTWADAELACRQLDANLPSIHSSKEHQFLRSLVKESAGAYVTTWAGGHDIAKEGSWMWSDGSNFEFTLWPRGEPNNWGKGEHCMEINFQNTKPNDTRCSAKKPYICSKSM
ncbi:galactose-specific lectin nattectin-like [Neosynchiropus ocellatus]